jgi:hypothetical protein
MDPFFRRTFALHPSSRKGGLAMKLAAIPSRFPTAAIHKGNYEPDRVK